MAKAIVKKPAQTTALANWEEELAKEAQEASDKEQTPSGQFISLRGGILSVAGTAQPNNRAQTIILTSIYENAMYEGKFDPDNPMPPCCYAFAEEEDKLAPHEKSGKPQHDQCTGCPNNEFKSADNGKGKACKNLRRLALISYNGLEPDSVKDAEIFFLKVPVTSVKAWASYVKGLAAVQKRPVWSVVTEIGVTPDPKSQFKVGFTPVDALGPEWYSAVKAKVEEAKNAIAFPYSDYVEPEAKPAPAAKSKFRK